MPSTVLYAGCYYLVNTKRGQRKKKKRRQKLAFQRTNKKADEPFLKDFRLD